MTPGCRVLHLDFETYSPVDISSSGSYKYIEDDDFQALLLAYAMDDEPVKVIDLTDPKDVEDLPMVIDLVETRSVVKVAHNCAFERAVLRKWLRTSPLDPAEWVDTMVLAAYNGLPMSLEGAGAALGLPLQKMSEGAALIRYFCKPCKPTKTNGGRTRNRRQDAPDKWATFREYCRRDVETAREIYDRLHSFPVTGTERRVFALDARINECGVLIDTELAQAALDVNAEISAELLKELNELTGCSNGCSAVQLKGWLRDKHGLHLTSLDKAAVADLLARSDLDPEVRRALDLRRQLSKTSCAKYETMLAAASDEDGRVRGLTQYYGAGRTGRWAGRLVQLQNLPQNHLEELDSARTLVRERATDCLRMIYDSVPDVLSQLIRTALIAPPGKTLLVADFSAIEARVIAWLAGETWRMETFANGGDIYCASASSMFKVPVVKHGVNGHLRQKGKVAELACGYGGGVGALKAFGADKMGLSEAEMQDIVDQWRAASPRICRLWRDIEAAVRRALDAPGTEVSLHGLTYRKTADALLCTLPSGRTISYWGAGIDDEGSVCYMSLNQTTRQWVKTSTWGGKLVENIVQAVARDCLAEAMLRLDDAGYKILFHVHDEVIAEADEGSRWEDMAEIMGQPISWAPGLLLRADGYSTTYYKKD